MALFSIAAILPDTGLLTNLDDLFTMEEWRSYWQTQNLRQYMSKRLRTCRKDVACCHFMAFVIRFHLYY